MLAWVGAVGLAALTIVLYLVGDGPWPASTMVRACIVVAAGAAMAWLLRRPRPAAGLVAYAAYAGSLLVVWFAAGGPDATRELWRQAAFLAVLAAAAAPLPVPRGALFGVHVGCLLLVWLQLAGPRSALRHGRAGRLLSRARAWSGYPELGLLMAVATCAMVAFACAARPPLVRVAAVTLALAFAAATVFLQSRSAVITIPIVGAVAARRRRREMALEGRGRGAGRGGRVGARSRRPRRRRHRDRLARRGDGDARDGDPRAGLDAPRATMFAEHPIIGVGLGGYQREYYERHLGADSTHAYNIVLHVLAESASIGLLGWLALWGRVLWVGVRHAADRRRAAPRIFALHGMLVAFLVRSQSEHFLANLLPATACCCWSRCGWASRKGSRWTPPASAPRGRTPRGAVRPL